MMKIADGLYTSESPKGTVQLEGETGKCSLPGPGVPWSDWDSRSDDRQIPRLQVSDMRDHGYLWILVRNKRNYLI